MDGKDIPEAQRFHAERNMADKQPRISKPWWSKADSVLVDFVDDYEGGRTALQFWPPLKQGRERKGFWLSRSGLNLVKRRGIKSEEFDDSKSKLLFGWLALFRHDLADWNIIHWCLANRIEKTPTERYHSFLTQPARLTRWESLVPSWHFINGSQL